MCGIEVNDNIKNNVFAINGISLLWFTAKEVRNNIENVVAKIIATADETDKKEHFLNGAVSEFRAADMLRSEG